MSNRVYSEEEVARLIRRAVELESSRSGSARSGDQKGLTMQDLEKIAAESGIDPELMHRAADELERKDTLDDLKDAIRVTRQEIVAEHWIKGELNQQVMDDLVIELNHRFGTSEEDINWWDRLWNDYSGKPQITRTNSSVDWRYKDEIELYTTRALIQQRGDKLRIRVSKRQGWNLSWNSSETYLSLGFMSLVLFTVIGSVLGFALLDNPLMGILGGASLAALLVPVTIAFSKRRLKRHIDEVSEIAEELVIQAKQLSKETKSYSKSNTKAGKTSARDSSIRAIEIDSDEENIIRESGLKNHLRE